jgi:hypothetical protein
MGGVNRPLDVHTDDTMSAGTCGFVMNPSDGIVESVRVCVRSRFDFSLAPFPETRRN